MSETAGPGPQRDPFAERLAILPCRIGEIIITRMAAGEFDLRHRDDAGRADLRAYSEAEAAIEIARYDDAGKYRPLKTAPNLRHGWRLLLTEIADTRRALDFFYPGRIATWCARKRGDLETTPLRATLARQTGMYRVAAQITDAQASELAAKLCRSDGGCLRTVLWPRDTTGAAASTLLPAAKFDPAYDQTGRNEETIPLFCQEACNLLVAAARGAVKAVAD